MTVVDPYAHHEASPRPNKSKLTPTKRRMSLSTLTSPSEKKRPFRDEKSKKRSSVSDTSYGKKKQPASSLTARVPRKSSLSFKINEISQPRRFRTLEEFLSIGNFCFVDLEPVSWSCFKCGLANFASFIECCRHEELCTNENIKHSAIRIIDSSKVVDSSDIFTLPKQTFDLDHKWACWKCHRKDFDGFIQASRHEDLCTGIKLDEVKNKSKEYKERETCNEAVVPLGDPKKLSKTVDVHHHKSQKDVITRADNESRNSLEIKGSEIKSPKAKTVEIKPQVQVNSLRYEFDPKSEKQKDFDVSKSPKLKDNETNSLKQPKKKEVENKEKHYLQSSNMSTGKESRREVEKAKSTMVFQFPLKETPKSSTMVFQFPLKEIPKSHTKRIPRKQSIELNDKQKVSAQVNEPTISNSQTQTTTSNKILSSDTEPKISNRLSTEESPSVSRRTIHRKNLLQSSEKKTKIADGLATGNENKTPIITNKSKTPTSTTFLETKFEPKTIKFEPKISNRLGAEDSPSVSRRTIHRKILLQSSEKKTKIANDGLATGNENKTPIITNTSKTSTSTTFLEIKSTNVKESLATSNDIKNPTVVTNKPITASISSFENVQSLAISSFEHRKSTVTAAPLNSDTYTKLPENKSKSIKKSLAAHSWTTANDFRIPTVASNNTKTVTTSYSENNLFKNATTTAPLDSDTSTKFSESKSKVMESSTTANDFKIPTIVTNKSKTATAASFENYVHKSAATAASLNSDTLLVTASSTAKKSTTGSQLLKEHLANKSTAAASAAAIAKYKNLTPTKKSVDKTRTVKEGFATSYEIKPPTVATNKSRTYTPTKLPENKSKGVTLDLSTTNDTIIPTATANKSKRSLSNMINVALVACDEIKATKLSENKSKSANEGLITVTNDTRTPTLTGNNAETSNYTGLTENVPTNKFNSYTSTKKKENKLKSVTKYVTTINAFKIPCVATKKSSATSISSSENYVFNNASLNSDCPIVTASSTPKITTGSKLLKENLVNKSAAVTATVSNSTSPSNEQYLQSIHASTTKPSQIKKWVEPVSKEVTKLKPKSHPSLSKKSDDSISSKSTTSAFQENVAQSKWVEPVSREVTKLKPKSHPSLSRKSDDSTSSKSTTSAFQENVAQSKWAEPVSREVTKLKPKSHPSLSRKSDDSTSSKSTTSAFQENVVQSKWVEPVSREVTKLKPKSHPSLSKKSDDSTSSKSTTSAFQENIAQSTSIFLEPPPNSDSSSLLSSPDDDTNFSAVHCFARKNLAFFSCTNLEAKRITSKFNLSIADGQVGIRCVHCSPSLGSNERKRRTKGHIKSLINGCDCGAIMFPSQVAGIYDVVKQFIDNCHWEKKCQIGTILQKEYLSIKKAEKDDDDTQRSLYSILYSFGHLEDVSSNGEGIRRSNTTIEKFHSGDKMVNSMSNVPKETTTIETVVINEKSPSSIIKETQSSGSIISKETEKNETVINKVKLSFSDDTLRKNSFDNSKKTEMNEMVVINEEKALSSNVEETRKNGNVILQETETNEIVARIEKPLSSKGEGAQRRSKIISKETEMNEIAKRREIPLASVDEAERNTSIAIDISKLVPIVYGMFPSNSGMILEVLTNDAFTSMIRLLVGGDDECLSIFTDKLQLAVYYGSETSYNISRNVYPAIIHNHSVIIDAISNFVRAGIEGIWFDIVENQCFIEFVKIVSPNCKFPSVIELMAQW